MGECCLIRSEWAFMQTTKAQRWPGDFSLCFEYGDVYPYEISQQCSSKEKIICYIITL